MTNTAITTTHPSPIKDILTIQVNTDLKDDNLVKVVLLNMFGQVVLAQQASLRNGMITTSVATLSYGVYQAKVQLGDQVFTQLVEKM